MRYIVASCDAVGNQLDGWEINDQHRLGTIDVSEQVANDDIIILELLNSIGFTQTLSIDDVYFMADSLDEIDIFDEETDRPILSLILEQ